MTKKDKYDDNPIWTKEDFKKAKRLHDLPESRQQKLRGLGKTPAAKEAVSIELSKDVVEALRATGNDWEKRADDVLREKFLNVSGAGKAA